MKKIIVGIFAFTLIFIAHNVLASTIWNGASNDCKFISVMNETTNEGYGSACWTLSSISAKEGDTVKVRIYYHNTGTTTANNTRVFLKAPSESSKASRFTLSGSISSDQGGESFGPVAVNISSAQPLIFSSVKWYTNNTSQTVTSLLNGQDGSEAIDGSGLNIGSIAPGWSTQGSVVVYFKVGSSTISQTCQDPGANNYGSASSCTYSTNNSCTISNFTANGSSSNVSINNGDALSLYWNTTGCTSVTVSGSNYSNSSLSSSASVYPQSSGYYTISAYGTDTSSGDRRRGTTSASQTKTIYVTVGGGSTNDSCTISSFTANGSNHSTSIDSGERVNLYWNTDGCTDVVVSGPSYTSYSKSGNTSVYPEYDSTYTVSAYSNNGTRKTKSIDINVDNGNYNDNTPSISTYSPNNITGTGATLSGYANGNGTLINSWIEFPCYGSQYGNRYSQSSSSLSTSVSSLSPSRTYSYCAVAQGVNNGQIYRGNVVTFTTTTSGPSVLNQNVVTTVATNISRNEAQVNGYLANSSLYNSNVHFDYGTTVDLGRSTQSKSTNGNSSFNDVLTGLTPNTIYFFQAVGEGSNGLSKGSVEIFRTLGDGTVRPAVIQGVTITGNDSPMMLKISNKYQLVGKGDSVDYTVTYKNIGKTKLTNPMVQVVLPTNVSLTNSSRGVYDIDTNTLSAQIEDLNKGEEGVIYIEGKVNSIPANNSQFVTTAIFVYTNSNGAQENAMAYVMNTPKGGSSSDNNLGGSAFFAGLVSLGLIGWLLIVLFIMALVLIARSLVKKAGTTVNTTPTH